MKSFVLSSVFACALAAPTTHVNEGVPLGPLTPAFGDAVQTPKGLRSLALEGFSEDLNQDGFVDPIGQAVVVAPAPVQYAHVAPVQYAHAAPVQYANVAPVQYTNAAAPVAYTHAAAPVAAPVTYTHAAVAPATYAVPQVTYAAPHVVTHAVANAAVPASTELLTRTVVAAPAVQYVAAPHYGYAPFLGALPAAAPVAA